MYDGAWPVLGSNAGIGDWPFGVRGVVTVFATPGEAMECAWRNWTTVNSLVLLGSLRGASFSTCLLISRITFLLWRSPGVLFRG